MTEEQTRRVDELQRELSALRGEIEVANKCDSLPVDVTAVMVVASDLTTCIDKYPMKYLAQTLSMLDEGKQSVPLNLYICPIEPDKDSAGAWLRKAAEETRKWPAAVFNEFRVLDPRPSRGGIYKNIAYGLDVLLDEVHTRFVMFLEPDTEPQAGVVFDLMRALEGDEKLGFVGGAYEFKSDHVKLGCSMMRAEVAKEIEWRDNGRCVCSWLCEEELPRRNLTSRHLDMTHRYARHRTQEV